MRGTVSEANRIEPVLNRTRTVTVIPPRTLVLPGMPTPSARPKRVAAYARVSTNSEEQLTSYEAQVKHYTEYIKCREHTDNWQFVSVYTEMLTPSLIQMHPTCTQIAPKLHPKCTQSRKLGAFVAFSESFQGAFSVFWVAI